LTPPRRSEVKHERQNMAKVEYADAIKTVSGALTKINKKSPHAADQKMVLATHRVAATTNPACSRLFLRGLSSVTRTTPYSADEKAAQTRFGNIAKAVQLRRKNVEQMVQDQQAFQAQKDTPGGYKTIKQNLWHVVADSLNG
ncbi:MAG: hypothetical protein J6W89_02390, partial [Paludibacteraceae bacterium]|nr:hypothetical protein [Paludibacteraceae bacterium]